jgi:hypothetical protein
MVQTDDERISSSHPDLVCRHPTFFVIFRVIGDSTFSSPSLSLIQHQNAIRIETCIFSSFSFCDDVCIPSHGMGGPYPGFHAANRQSQSTVQYVRCMHVCMYCTSLHYILRAATPLPCRVGGGPLYRVLGKGKWHYCTSKCGFMGSCNPFEWNSTPKETGI